MNYPQIKHEVSLLKSNELFNDLAYYKAQYEIRNAEGAEFTELCEIDARVRAIIIEMRSRDLYVN